MREREPLTAEQWSLLGDVDDLWRTAEKLSLRSVMVEWLDGRAVREHYLILYRWAMVGRGAGAEIAMPGEYPQRRCMRLLRLGDQLWLGSLVEDGCLTAREGGMPPHTAVPLHAEAVVRYEEAALTFSNQAQRTS